MNMDEFNIYKKEGNRLFSLSQKYDINDTEYQINLKKSCESYGECLNAMIKLESSEDFINLNSKEIEEFNYMKPCIFQNLALANIKLGGYEGCRRCCNAAILFCNKPYYLLEDMGTEDDMTIDMTITAPVLPAYNDILTKSLYRRGQCLQYLEYLELAHQDYLLCKRISPNNKVVITSINEIEKMLLRDKQNSKSGNNNNNKFNDYVLDQSDISSITQNGGKCFLRKGYWSQSVTETRVYFPMSLLIKEHNQIYTSKIDNMKSSKLKCEFSSMSMKILYDDVILFDLFIEYMIINKSCTWMLETYGSCSNSSKNESNHPNYLVIYLYKSPSVEWFAGCEWWDRVFAGKKYNNFIISFFLIKFI
jgi:hypothetical protein